MLLDLLQLLMKFVFYFNLHLIASPAFSTVLDLAVFVLLGELRREKSNGLSSVLGCHVFYICLKEIRNVVTLCFVS